MYIINQFLTAGAFGIICKGYHKHNKSQLVAIKFPLSCTEFKTFNEITPYLNNLRLISPEKLLVSQPTSSDIMNFKREANITSILSKHQNIVRLLEFRFYVHEIKPEFNIKVPMIITEFCEGGNLLTYLQNHKSLSERECNYLFTQLIDGIEYAHSLKIVHHDIKLENILLKKKPELSIPPNFLSKITNYLVSYLYLTTNKNEDDQNLSVFCYELKICDWGFAQIGSDNFNSTSGSPHYSAPEIYAKGINLSPSIDIWSAGVCLFAMVTGKLPFYSSDSFLLRQMIIDGKYDKDFLSMMASKSLFDLIEKILIIDPNKRYTIQQIKSHPWYSSFFPN